MTSLRVRALGIAATAAVIAGTVVLHSPAAKAITCPNVASGTGSVTPAPAPGVDWSGCDLTGANLAGANLTAANMSGADLAGADLSGSNLVRANLDRANLTGSNLSDAGMGNSSIDNAVLTGADLNGTIMRGISTVLDVKSGGITGIPASLPVVDGQPTLLIDGYLAGRGVNLAGADLAAADLAGIQFDSATFENADLSGANLTGASVDGDVAGANLSGTDLKDAYLAGVNSGGIIGQPSAMPANWRLVDGYLIGPDAQVPQANLTGANLSGADMQMMNLGGTNLTDADMAGANLSKAGLVSATLTGADLSGANLAGLSSASIAGTPAALPRNWTLRSGYLFGPKAFLYAADLSDQDLSGLDLAGAFLENSNLTGVNLTGTNAVGADLGGATIAHANVTKTMLAGALLETIRSGGGVTGSPASLPASWVLRSGWLIGPDVFLDHENLDGVNLSGADMAEAEASFSTFTGANLSGTDLAGAILASDFTKANLRGADLFGTYLNGGNTWTGATCPDGTSASSHGNNCATALAFRFGGFIAPKPGSTVAASARHVTVHFKLATSSGAAIPASVAVAIGAARQVRVTLTGPRIKATTAYCFAASSGGEFTCTITDPHGIEKGKSHSYTITAAERPGATFQAAPRLGRAANPEIIHFG